MPPTLALAVLLHPLHLLPHPSPSPSSARPETVAPSAHPLQLGRLSDSHVRSFLPRVIVASPTAGAAWPHRRAAPAFKFRSDFSSNFLLDININIHLRRIVARPRTHPSLARSPSFSTHHTLTNITTARRGDHERLQVRPPRSGG